jgi:mannose-P-dolichol utilization defect protein 1
LPYVPLPPPFPPPIPLHIRNHANPHTQVFNYLAGSLSRIFTTLQEVDDKLILYGFVAGFALNAVLAAQMVYYWNAAPARVQPKEKQTQKQVAAASKAAQAKASPKSKSKSPTTRRRA